LLPFFTLTGLMHLKFSSTTIFGSFPTILTALSQMRSCHSTNNDRVPIVSYKINKKDWSSHPNHIAINYSECPPWRKLFTQNWESTELSTKTQNSIKHSNRFSSLPIWNSNIFFHIPILIIRKEHRPSIDWTPESK
jgi:hypothetical protein